MPRELPVLFWHAHIHSITAGAYFSRLMNLSSSYRRPRLANASTPGQAAVVPVQLQELDCLSSVRIYIPKDLRPPDARQMALKVCHTCSSAY